MDYWVNIDFKEDLYRLHKSSCLHMKKVPTETKGIQEMNIPGGWFKFKSVRMARAYGWMFMGRRPDMASISGCDDFADNTTISPYLHLRVLSL